MILKLRLFQFCLKKPFIILSICFAIFLGSLGNWVTSLYEENKKLTPLQREIQKQQKILSSVKELQDFKENIAPFSIAAMQYWPSYASSWNLEKIKLISFLKEHAIIYAFSDLTYQFGSVSSDTSLIPINLSLYVQDPLSILQFIRDLYQGPYSLYLTQLSIDKTETGSFKANLSLKWSFPEHKNVKNLLDFLHSLNAPSIEDPFSFKEEFSILASIFQKEKTIPFKEAILSPHLTGILYTNPNEWTIWINNHPITPKDNPSPYVILSVTSHTVQLKTPEGPFLLSLQKQNL